MQKNQRTLTKGYISLGEIFIRRSDYSKYYVCETKIIDLINEGKPVPAAWLIKERKYFTSLKQILKEKFGIQAQKFTNKALQQIKNFKEREKYEFKGESWRTVDAYEDPQLDNHNLHFKPIARQELYSYSLSDLFEKLIIEYLYYHYQQDSVSIEETTRLFYRNLREFKNTLNEKHQKEFTDYKMRAFAGVLTQAVGRKLSYETNPQPHQLYLATRYALKDME